MNKITNYLKDIVSMRNKENRWFDKTKHPQYNQQT